jgi:glycerophosphoryl diester phosphodiesterase
MGDPKKPARPPSSVNPDRPMLVLAHRGCRDRVPESNPQAFEAAAALGVDGIEER